MGAHSDRERKLDKIKKCLALSGSSNPNEAEIALRQARKLMDDLGLTMDDVEASKVGEVFRRTGLGEVRQAPRWILMLADMVSEAFSCTMLARRGPGGNGVVFIGVEPNPELASYAFEVMSHQLTAARKKFLEDSPSPHRRGARNTLRKQGSLFVEGWLYSVWAKIKDFAGMDEDTARAINAYMAKDYPDLPPARPVRKKKERLQTREELMALHMGVQAGNKATLHRAAAGGATIALLPGAEPEQQAAQASLF